MRCLTVDDSKIARSVVRRALDRLHIEVQEACSAEDALNLIEEQGSFDVVFLDWEMPGMTGPQLLREAQSRNIVLGQHVIMCTSRNATNDLLEALELGVSEYLMKPFTPEDLKQKLLLVGLNVNEEK
jgi:two-component system, chemotaxis family, chemotaxis protein CheY